MARELIELSQWQDQLQDYLLQRFGNLRLARWATRETINQLDQSPLLETVGNPYFYAIGYALSLALTSDGKAPLTLVPKQ